MSHHQEPGAKWAQDAIVQCQNERDEARRQLAAATARAEAAERERDVAKAEALTLHDAIERCRALSSPSQQWRVLDKAVKATPNIDMLVWERDEVVVRLAGERGRAERRAEQAEARVRVLEEVREAAAIILQQQWWEECTDDGCFKPATICRLEKAVGAAARLPAPAAAPGVGRVQALERAVERFRTYYCDDLWTETFGRHDKQLEDAFAALDSGAREEEGLG